MAMPMTVAVFWLAAAPGLAPAFASGRHWPTAADAAVVFRVSPLALREINFGSGVGDEAGELFLVCVEPLGERLAFARQLDLGRPKSLSGIMLFFDRAFSA